MADRYSGCGRKSASRSSRAWELAEALLKDGLGRRRFFRHELGIGRAMQLAAHVDVRLEGERRVEHRLDALQARRLDRLLDALRVRRRVLDDVAAGHGVEAGEELIVPRE